MADAVIRILSGPFKGKEVPVPEDRIFVLGRDPTSDVQVQGPTVSRKHTQIVYRNGQFVATDMGSKNKTRVNGGPISEQPLQDKDIIRIGKVQMQFVTGDSVREPAPVVAFDDEEEGDGGTEIVDMNAFFAETTDEEESFPVVDQGPDAPRVNVQFDDMEGDGGGTEILDMKNVITKEKAEGIDLDELKTQAIEGGVVKVPAPGKKDEMGTDLLNMDDIVQKGSPLKNLTPIQIFYGASGVVILILVIVIIGNLLSPAPVQTAEHKPSPFVGQNFVKNIETSQSNPIVGASSSDPEIVELVYMGSPGKGFMKGAGASSDPKRGKATFHFLVKPSLPGAVRLTFAFKNGDRFILTVEVKPSKVRKEGRPVEEVLEEVRKNIEEGKTLINKPQIKNFRIAFQKFRRAHELMRKIPFGTFLDEFKDARKNFEEAKDRLVKKRSALERQFVSALERQTGQERGVLKTLLELRLDKYDPKYLEYETWDRYRFR